MKMRKTIATTMIKESVKEAHNGAQHKNNERPKTGPLDCDEVQLTNAQCHMVPIYLSSRES